MKSELINLPYFSLSQASLYYSSRNVALVNISRLLKGWIIQKIRKWYYVHSDFIARLNHSWEMNDYLEFIATNIIYTPSYISSEYILYESGVLTENVYGFTLISTKKTKKLKNDFGRFSYRSIKKIFFDDFVEVQKNNFTIYKATKEKALFDYFYLKRDIVFEESYFSELRLNMENIEMKAFERLVEKYQSKKMKKVFIYLQKLAW